MVRRRQRSTTQQTWSSKNMLRAIEAVKNEGMCFKTASRNYNVPRSTLKRRVLNVNKDAVDNKKMLGAYRPVFSKDQEEEILQLILDMEQRFYGFTGRDVRLLAFELAEKNKIPHPFNKTLQMAGEDWLVGFRKRHPQLSLRTPESTSIARAQGFNKVIVSKFFDLLNGLMSKYNYPPHRIYNVDETSLTTTQAKNSKVLALKGRRQVGAISSAERGVLCTAVICMAAGGNFVPPMVIFPRKRMKIELTEGAPPGCAFACSDSGWMKLDIFEQWFEHFLSFEKPTKEDPILLILDGHNTHTKNLAVIKKARANNVEILCLPPHCSHKLQPLDVSFNFPLNTYYVQGIEKFLRQNPGRVITQFQVSRLFGEAYLQASTPKTAINGFRKTGIHPCDMDVFPETDFAPSLTTDKLNLDAESGPLVKQAEELDPEKGTKTYSPQHRTGTDELQIPENQILDVQPCSSITMPVEDQQQTTQNNFLNQQTCSSFAVSPREIRPLPKKKINTQPKKRKCGTTVVLTSSPYKNELEQELQGKDEKEKNKKKRAEAAVRDVFNDKTNAMKKPIKVEKRQLPKQRRNSDSDSLSENRTIKKKLSKKAKKRKLNVSASTEESSSEEDNDNPECLYCGDTYLRSRKGDGWISCSQCKNWAHDECAGIGDDELDFVCEKCL